MRTIDHISKQLEEAQKSQTDILDCLPFPVFVVRKDRVVLNSNLPARDLFGDDLLGHDIVRAIRHPSCLKVLNKVLNGKPKATSIFTSQKPVETIYQVSVVALENVHSDGAYAVISFEDISHIQEAEQMRSDFVANVSHELKSPLTTLYGYIETLMDEEDTSERQRMLAIMREEANRMNRLIEDTLSLSKVEVHEHLRPTTQVDIVNIVENVVTSLEHFAHQEKKSVRILKQTTTPHLPGDKDQLFQVFRNLIENSIKYAHPETEILVTIEQAIRSWSPNGNVIAVEIKDKSPGISPHQIPRLTERFYRVDPGRSRDMGGTGLGLAIVKHIVNRHRGRLQIRSQLDSGSSFTVHLPTGN